MSDLFDSPPGESLSDKSLVAEGEDEEELEMLIRSLEDLEQEFEDGEVSETDYHYLRRSYLQRIADELNRVRLTHDPQSNGNKEITAQSDHDVATGRRTGHRALGVATLERTSRYRRLSSRRGKLLVATAVFFVVAVVGVVGFATNRLPGQTPSGSLRLDQAQRMDVEISRAASLVNEGKDARAMEVYSKVLEVDPHQPQALAGLGWLEYEAGVAGSLSSLVSKGVSSEEKALTVDSHFAYAHLYLAAMLFYYYKEPDKAASQLEGFIADHPSAQLVAEAEPLIAKVFAADGHPLSKSLSIAGK